ncbi:MAG TPA: HAMP domain-containing sensor histidine kinase [Kofleriaceae bacterium]|nr:HAMP domain-containing sensor histidine kinase [Kofleriaceae bacterium]
MLPGPAPPLDVQAVLDAAPCGLAQLTDDAGFRQVNRVFCAWVGLTADELIGHRRLPDLLTVGGRIFYQTHWAPLLRMQGSIAEVKVELVHRDGSTLPVVLNAVRREEGGVVVHQLAGFVARDRDRYEQELLRARRRLEESVAEISRLHAEVHDRAVLAEQMIGIVSHDLRNPMSTLCMGAAVLAGGELNASQRRVVGQMARATDHATRLIADLLDFTQARLGSGLATEAAEVDIHAVVADALEDLRLAHPERAVAHTASGCGTCTADANRIAQLLGNLVANAVAYGHPEVPITVTTRVTDDACEISVHNGGPPIPADVQARLFQPMTRGTRAGSRARSVGLGLFIVHEIVRAHGGTTSVRSTADEGTTFRAVFPRHGLVSNRPAGPA